MSKQHYRSQRPIKGGRARLYVAVLPEIEQEILRLHHKYRVSKSFVAAVIFGKEFHVDDQETYKPR